MAPRKRGSRRIDAALDAMRPYGFSGNLVQQTVKELLGVYGGEAGWIFVEEASYTLLIETILEKQRDEVPKVGQEIDQEALPIEGPSHLNEVSYSATEAVGIPLLTYQVSDLPSQTTDHGGDIEASQRKIPSAQSTPRSPRRKPYYGWICSDSEEDLVDLVPAHTQEELSKLLHRSSKQKKHNMI